MANPLDLEPDLIPFASAEERQLLAARALAVDDEQAMMAEIRRGREAWLATLNPTEEQILAVAHSENQTHARSGYANQQFWAALKADWIRKQKPTAEDIRKARNHLSEQSTSSEPSKPEQEPDSKNLIDATGVYQTPQRPADWKGPDLPNKQRKKRNRKTLSKAITPLPTFRQHVYAWLKRYGGLAFVSAAIGMAGLGEYAVGMALLTLAFLASVLQIDESSGHSKRQWIVRLIKGVWFLGAVAVLFFLGAVFNELKGSKPWSNLYGRDHDQKTDVSSTPSPVLPAREIASPSRELPSREIASPSVTPSPLPSIKKLSKKVSAVEQRRRRLEALRALELKDPKPK